MTTIRAPWLAPVALTCALACGCGRSAASRAEQAKSRLRSWDATLALLQQEQARGALPAPFADQVRRAAREERRRVEEQLRKTESP